jgi:hypothetical protein
MHLCDLRMCCLTPAALLHEGRHRFVRVYRKTPVSEHPILEVIVTGLVQTIGYLGILVHCTLRLALH